MASTTLPAPADTLGGRIRQARTYKQIKQNELGDRVAVSRETISAWENGRTAPTVPELLLIADATGFAARFFIDDLPTTGPAGRTAGCQYVLDLRDPIDLDALVDALDPWVIEPRVPQPA